MYTVGHSINPWKISRRKKTRNKANTTQIIPSVQSEQPLESVGDSKIALNMGFKINLTMETKYTGTNTISIFISNNKMDCVANLWEVVFAL